MYYRIVAAGGFLQRFTAQKMKKIKLKNVYSSKLDSFVSREIERTYNVLNWNRKRNLTKQKKNNVKIKYKIIEQGKLIKYTILFYRWIDVENRMKN